MTKIEFVLLADDAQAEDADQFVYRHAYAASSNGGLYIHTANETECRLLDERLWSSDNRDFIPHQLAESSDSYNLSALPGKHTANVLIGCNCEPDGSHQTLLNTGTSVPWFFNRFENLIELVRPDETERKMGRERYLYYKRRGYPLRYRQL